MEARGIHASSRFAKGVALSVVMLAVCGGMWAIWRAPLSTDDATIDAEVVHVAAVVGGRVVDLPIHENELIRKGALLFRIDPAPYQTAVATAQANLDIAEAAHDAQRRVIATQQSGARLARQQTQRAETNLALTARTEERLAPLTAKGYVAVQQLDQAQVAKRDAGTSLRQAREQELAARQAVGIDAGSEAGVRAAAAALENAKRALQDTEVRASHDGRVVGLNVSTGEIVAPAQSLFTLINTEEWFASANFRETELQSLKPGVCATVYSMIDRRHPIRGEIVSLGYGVLATDRINLPRALPYVQPSLNWVRVAQRFPVRIRLEEPPEALARLGASAMVEVGGGAACR